MGELAALLHGLLYTGNRYDLKRSDEALVACAVLAEAVVAVRKAADAVVA